MAGRTPVARQLRELRAEAAARYETNVELHNKLQAAAESQLALQAEVERVIGERDDALENAMFWRKRFDEVSKSSQQNYEDAKRYEKERDNARAEVQEQRGANERLSGMLTEARAHADLMRRQAYPVPPPFPWEAV